VRTRFPAACRPVPSILIGTAALQRLARELMPDRVSLRTNYKWGLRNFINAPSRERETFAGMNKLTCVRGVAQRDEVGEARGDMDEGPPLCGNPPPSAPRTTFTLAPADATEAALAASRAGRSLNPPRSLG